VTSRTESAAVSANMSGYRPRNSANAELLCSAPNSLQSGACSVTSAYTFNKTHSTTQCKCQCNCLAANFKLQHTRLMGMA
jgi:hypothetical protein